MPHDDTLGFSRGARCVNHISRMQGVRFNGRILFVFSGNKIPFDVHADRARLIFRQIDFRIVPGQQQFDVGFFQDKVKTLFRIKRIQRHIGSARFQDSQNAFDHIRRSFHAYSDKIAGADTKRTQVIRQLIRAGI